jgi:hypothetical protein
MRFATALSLVLLAGCGDDGGGPPDMSASLADMTVQDMVTLDPECDVFTQTGCSSPLRCTIGTQGGTPRAICVPAAANPLGEGAACMAVPDAQGRMGDNCATGLVCLDFPGDGPHCRRPCYERAHCGAGNGCVFTSPARATRTDADAGDELLAFCAHDDGCDPVAQTVCTGDRHCWLSPADDVGRLGVCLMNLAPGMAGADCKAQAECAPGFRCNGLGFCRRYCYFDTPDGGAQPGQGECPAAEGICDRFSFPAIYGICGGQ